MQYNPDFDICSMFFLILMICVFLTNRNTFDFSYKMYGVFLFLVLVNTTLSIVGIYAIANSSLLPIWLNYLINILYYISLASISAVYMIYVFSLTRIINKILKFYYIVLWLIYGCLVLSIITTPWTRLFFYFNGFVYTRGPGIFIMFIISFIFVSIGMITLIKNKDKISKIQFMLVIIFAPSICIVSIAQYFITDYMIFGMLLTLSLMSMFLTFQNPRDHIDKQTNLYCQRAFIQVIDRLYAKKNNNLNLLVIEIENIKNIESVYGVYSSYNAVKQTADIFIKVIEKSRNVFYLGENRFVLLIKNEDFNNKLEQISRGFTSPLQIKNCSVSVKYNMCRIQHIDVAKDCEELLYIIDKLMLLSKQKECENCLIADKLVIDEINRIRMIENKMCEPGKENCIDIKFQPIFDVINRKFNHSEVLIRINCPEIGEVSPFEFISIAERSGIISEIGFIVFEKACRFINEEKLWEVGVESVAINLSILECMQDDLFVRLKAIKDQYPNCKTRINFEITESIASNASDKISAVLRELVSDGSDIIIDDFGTGYSNIDLILHNPFNTVKLDISLLKNSMSSGKAKKFVQGIVKTFKNMKFNVIGEGAETQEEYNTLLDIGVDFVQGYYLSKPLSPDEYIAFLKSKNQA